MSADDNETLCGPYADLLAELALGILTGRGRAATSAHVEECPRCADELEQLARAADAAVSVAPDVEPPLGFETRLFERMGIGAAPARRRFQPPRWALAAAAAAAVLGIGLGVSLSGGSNEPRTEAAGTHRMEVASGRLVEDGDTVGHVFAYGGSDPWMLMTLDDSSAQGTVHCAVVTKDGVTHAVGTFTAKDGYGAWGSPLHVPPKDIRRAEVVAPNGTVIATATLS
jgi:hypothetical protein